jgi:hypothetical protein
MARKSRYIRTMVKTTPFNFINPRRFNKVRTSLYMYRSLIMMEAAAFGGE